MRKITYSKKCCARCGKSFDVEKRLLSKQIYCGSKTAKTGCSRTMALERLKISSKQPERRAKVAVLSKAWKKRQRENKTAYAARERENQKKSRLRHLESRKRDNKIWRAANRDRIRHNNKQRWLLKKGLGRVTLKQWIDIKARYKYRCNNCGISESELAVKWAGTQFLKLTMDHVVPISKGGKNDEQNIQPLCVSCNSSKKDSLTAMAPFSKVLSDLEVSEWRQAQFGRVVFTNGCFDVFHVGHLELLFAAKRLGSKVIVGVNSDASVKELKGKSRPINRQEDRVRVLSAFWPVDAVLIFDDKRVTRLITDIRPDVWLKGGDYTLETLNPLEVEAAREVGAEIVLFPMVTGYSTTDTLRKLNA